MHLIYTVLASSTSLTIGCALSLHFSPSISCGLLIDLLVAFCNVILPSRRRHTVVPILPLFARVSLFIFFCFLPLSFHHLKGLLYLSLPPPLSFTHFIFSPFPTAVVKSEPRATSFSSRPVHLVRSSLLSSLLAITLPLCTFFFLLHLPFHFRFLCHPPLPLQGAVTSDLFDSLLALRSRCAYECPHGGESECLLLSHSPLCVCVCMLRAV